MDGQIDLTGETTAAPGQLVVVELEQWEKQQNPRGRVLEVLGWPGDAGVDIVAVIQVNAVAVWNICSRVWKLPLFRLLGASVVHRLRTRPAEQVQRFRRGDHAPI